MTTSSPALTGALKLFCAQLNLQPRFMESSQDSGRPAKVQFEEDGDLFSHESVIKIVQLPSNLFEAHVGFLQFLHHYEIAFDFDYDSTCGLLSALQQETPELNARITSVQCEVKPDSPTTTCHLIVALYARKERILKAKLQLQSDGSRADILTITVVARVLGRGKGTPSLRSGIKCVGRDEECDSEQSDWQGFNSSELP